MKHFYVTAVLVLALSFASGQEQWEYAQLVRDADDFTHFWTGPNGEAMMADNVTALYNLMGGSSDLEGNIVDMFNLLGSRGWELVISEDGDAFDTFYFKRIVQ